MSTSTSPRGLEMYSYDVEWQLVRGYWGARVLGSKDQGQGPWTTHSTGLENLRLYQEYIQRSFSPFRDSATVLGESERGSSHANLRGELAYSLWGDIPNNDVRVGTQYSDGEYARLTKDRTSKDISLMTKEEKTLLYERTLRVSNAMAGTLMNLPRTCPSLVPVTQQFAAWVKRLETTTMGLTQITPTTPDEFFKRQETWLNITKGLTEPQWLRLELMDPVTHKGLQLPYYISILRDPMHALSRLRADMVQRWSVAKRRTPSANTDPTKRVHLRRFMELLLKHAPTVRPQMEPVTHDTDDYIVGSMDWSIEPEETPGDQSPFKEDD